MRESELRKNRSIKILKEFGIPFIDHLPEIEDSSSSKLRSKEEIVHRAMALAAVTAKAEGVDDDRLDYIISRYNLKDHFTEIENEFMSNCTPSSSSKTQLIWRYEAYWVLLGALGYVKELSYPDTICNVPFAVLTLAEKSAEEFLQGANLRSHTEILDQADLIYRYNWAVKNNWITGLASPANLDGSIVQERHHALNWLIGYSDDDWDHISTDT
jgi:hypothetical protein